MKMLILSWNIIFIDTDKSQPFIFYFYRALLAKEVVLVRLRLVRVGLWSKPEISRLRNIVLWAWETRARELNNNSQWWYLALPGGWRGGEQWWVSAYDGWQCVDIITHPAISMRILSLLNSHIPSVRQVGKLEHSTLPTTESAKAGTIHIRNTIHWQYPLFRCRLANCWFLCKTIRFMKHMKSKIWRAAAGRELRWSKAPAKPSSELQYQECEEK